jgi:hypothetical protein
MSALNEISKIGLKCQKHILELQQQSSPYILELVAYIAKRCVWQNKKKTVMHMAWQALNKERCGLFGQGQLDWGCRPVRSPPPFSLQK